MSFGTQSRLRREALSKMEEVMATEHELLSLGGQAAAAAHSLGTPLSTIKIITHDLKNQFKDQEDVKKDIELLSSQVERCNEILKRLTLNPVEEDEFIDKVEKWTDKHINISKYGLSKKYGVRIPKQSGKIYNEEQYITFVKNE